MNQCRFDQVPIGSLVGTEKNYLIWRKISNDPRKNVEDIKNPTLTSYYYSATIVYWVEDEEVVP